MEHINGDYNLELHASDYRADKSQVWDLGKISVWFKQGQDEGNNQGIKEEYKPAKVIEHIFPPESPESSLVVSLHSTLIHPIASHGRSSPDLIRLPSIRRLPLHQQSQPFPPFFHRHSLHCKPHVVI
jgi:hypothetical protein